MPEGFVTCKRCGFDSPAEWPLDENGYCFDCRMMSGPPKPPAGTVLPQAMKRRLEA